MKKLIIATCIWSVVFSCDSKEQVQQEETTNLIESPVDSEISDVQKKEYLEKGKEIATQAQGILGKNLMNAINTNGTVYAVDFCSEKAIPLTDSSALLANVKLKRVSDKNRNPDNAANASELKIINLFKSQIDQGKPIEPEVVWDNGKHIGYYPIVSNAMCLQCHGTKEEQVQVETLAKLNALYPEDKALGYDVNQLRGMWVVEME